jgi:hypothetical protein
MKTIVLPLIAAAAIAAQPAFAGLHKCTTKEGKTIYTEFECDADAKKGEVTIRESKGVDTTKGGSPIHAPDKDGKGAPGKAPPTPAAPAAAPDKAAPAPPK